MGASGATSDHDCGLDLIFQIIDETSLGSPSQLENESMLSGLAVVWCEVEETMQMDHAIALPGDD